MPFQKGHKDFRTKKSIEEAKKNLKKLAENRKGISSDTSHLKEYQFKESVEPWNKGKAGTYKKKFTSNKINRGKWKQWRLAVFIRDLFICQDCGEDKKDKLRAHHLKSRQEYPELIFVVDNGITLCIRCHAKKHFPKGSRFGINVKTV